MKFMVYVVLVAVMGLSVVVGYQFERMNHARITGRDQTCEGFTALDNSFVKLIREGEKQAATLAYYREHPDELRRVIEQDERAIRVLVPPPYCNQGGNA